MPTIDPKLEFKLALIPDALARLKAQLETTFIYNNYIKSIYSDTIWYLSNEGQSYWHVLSILVDSLEHEADENDIFFMRDKYPETYEQILPLLKDNYK